MHYKYLILGAGPTGLGAAYRLRELSEESFLVLEKSALCGGLSGSFVDSMGFTWDVGSHVQFSHYEYFDRVMNEALGQNGWFHHERKAWAWLDNTFIPYPVQNNIRYLSKEKIWQCLEGILDPTPRTGVGSISHLQSVDLTEKPTSSFKDWIYRSFGPGLAEVFMLKYNYKVWAHPPEQMSSQWVGDRVATIDYKSVIKNIILGHDDVNWGPNNAFRFPKKGGTGAIWNSIAAKIGENKLRLSSEVQTIDHQNRWVLLSNGTKIQYEFLLTTMPLPHLCKRLTPSIQSHLTEKSNQLRYSSSNIIGLGIKGKLPEQLDGKSWIYFSEDDVPFYRISLFSSYSPNHVPDPENQWSLITETSESKLKSVDHKNLVEQVIQACIKSKFFNHKRDVLSTWYHREEYGYPTPSLDRDSILTDLLPYLETLNVYSRGRFGAWKYEVSNQDHSFMQGVEWVNRMAYGTPEVTLNSASTINSGSKKIAA